MVQHSLHAHALCTWTVARTHMCKTKQQLHLGSRENICEMLLLNVWGGENLVKDHNELDLLTLLSGSVEE